MSSRRMKKLGLVIFLGPLMFGVIYGEFKFSLDRLYLQRIILIGNILSFASEMYYYSMSVPRSTLTTKVIHHYFWSIPVGSLPLVKYKVMAVSQTPFIPQIEFTMQMRLYDTVFNEDDAWGLELRINEDEYKLAIDKDDFTRVGLSSKTLPDINVKISSPNPAKIILCGEEIARVSAGDFNSKRYIVGLFEVWIEENILVPVKINNQGEPLFILELIDYE